MNQFSAKINKRTIGIVTIDVEPDNVWRNTHSKSLRNINELPNFHKICKEFGVRPTYFVCWSVANDDNSKKILLDLLNQGDCEIGIHPHLWEIPPLISQDSSKIAWTGPDYSTEILEAKLTTIFNLISSNFGIPLSHRAGRWCIDERQVEILTNLGIKYDSSILPGIDWSKTGILDHTKAPLNSYFMDKNNICLPGISSLLEVPCTIKPGINLGSIGKIK